MYASANNCSAVFQSLQHSRHFPFFWNTPGICSGSPMAGNFAGNSASSSGLAQGTLSCKLQTAGTSKASCSQDDARASAMARSAPSEDVNFCSPHCGNSAKLGLAWCAAAFIVRGIDTPIPAGDALHFCRSWLGDGILISSPDSASNQTGTSAPALDGSVTNVSSRLGWTQRKEAAQGSSARKRLVFEHTSTSLTWSLEADGRDVVFWRVAKSFWCSWCRELHAVLQGAGKLYSARRRSYTAIFLCLEKSYANASHARSLRH